VKTLDSLEALCQAIGSHEPLYVRYSKGPEHDQTQTSRDYEAELDMPGLSVNPLAPEPWWTKPIEQWVARQLCQYVKLHEGEGRRAWVLRGQISGYGPDREPLLQPWEPVAWLSDDLIAQARACYHTNFNVGHDSTSASE
jgi:hypothetical protein